ncbi:MAG: dihydroxy-acid dehydratase, partial [Methylococcales bacterium]|nr:dihydroxy-acid dehydratase [Methylococcales bacterium]
EASLDKDVLATVKKPFATGGGLHVMHGNLGRGVSKLSAVSEDHQIVKAPAVVFDDQEDFLAAFQRGELEKDFVAVIRFQGPRSNGMPELHKLTPPLGVLQDKGFKVALVTDGRMSGASGKVPSAIHLCPECEMGGPLAKVLDGDIISLNLQTGNVNALVDEAEFNARIPIPNRANNHHYGMGREMFGGFRLGASTAETGASNLFPVD